MRTKSDRLNIINEIKMKCIELDLTQDLATKILFTMLDQYHEKGTTYSKELKLVQRHETPRKYVVNLHNDPKIKDTVLIRALDIGELQPTKKIEPSPIHEEESSDDEDAPDLV